MAALELLAGATWAKVIAARNGYLVDWLSRIADGFFTWSTAGKPVRMNVARGGGDQVNEGLMSSNGILVGVNQFLQPVPAAFGAVYSSFGWGEIESHLLDQARVGRRFRPVSGWSL